MLAAERQQETVGDGWSFNQSSRRTGQMRARARARKGADVGQVSLRRTY